MGAVAARLIEVHMDVVGLVATQAKLDGFWFPREGAELDLFVFGVRGSPRDVDAFDDLIGVVWFERGAWQHMLVPGTTDPGLRAMERHRHPDGVARIVPGQYRGVWQLGRRSNGREALLQVGRFRVQRDGDGDDVYNEDAGTYANGSALLLHEPYRDGLQAVGMASEGCQVPARMVDARAIFDLVRRQAAAGRGSRVSYTLWDAGQAPALRALWEVSA